MNSLFKSKLALTAASLVFFLSACGGSSEPEEASASVRTSESAPPAAVSVSPISTQTLLAQGAKLNAATLSEAEAQALAADKIATKTDLDQLAPGAIAPKSAYTSGTVRQKASDKLVPVWRFYNSATGAHFVTLSTVERDNVIAKLAPPKGPFQFEGEAFMVANAPSPGLSPVHRFYNTQTGVHFYTISDTERAHIVATMPHFAYEGIAYYASQVTGQGTTPFYRFYVPGKGFHFYTASQQERDNIIANLGAVYTYEGVGFSVLTGDWVPYQEPVPRDIVVVGNYYSDSKTIGKMWRNGVEQNLPVGDNSKESVAIDIKYAGNNFIVAGYYPRNIKISNNFLLWDEAKLWHNGAIPQHMNTVYEGHYRISGLTVSGSDIYVSGSHENGANHTSLYWKNNNPIVLQDNKISGTSKIASESGNIYVAGGAWIDLLESAVIWSNGSRSVLSSKYSAANDLQVKNGTVYVAGTIHSSSTNKPTAVVWKNGIPQYLTDDKVSSSNGAAIAVSQNNDVYVAGTEYFSSDYGRARLWKNGVQIYLEGAEAGSRAYDVEVAGNDVYVVGYVNEYTNGYKTPALWINGRLQKLTDGYSNTYAIAVAVK